VLGIQWHAAASRGWDSSFQWLHEFRRVMDVFKATDTYARHYVNAGDLTRRSRDGCVYMWV